MSERESGETARYSGILHLGDDIEIPCGVMDDGTQAPLGESRDQSPRRQARRLPLAAPERR